MGVTSLILAVFLIVIVIAFLLWRPSTTKSEAMEPVCGKCGYIVKGLPSSICPECGSDLKRVGIITHRSCSAISPILFILCWSVLTLLGTRTYLAGRPYESKKTRGLVPLSQSYERIDVLGGELEYQSGSAIGTMKLYLSNPPEVYQCGMEIDFPSLTYRYQLPENNGDYVDGDMVLDKEAMLQWMNSAGVDVENGQVADETADIVSLVSSVSKGHNCAGICDQLKFFQSHKIIGVPPKILPDSWFAALAIIWLVVLVFVLRRLMQHRAPKTESI